jgi:hypothetical protein
MTVHGNTGGFDLPVGNPHPVKGNQTEIPECNTISPGCVSGHISALDFTMLNTFRT